MTYTVHDLETQIHQGFKRKANPFLKDNFIVARGWKHKGDSQGTAKFYKSVDEVDQFDIPASTTVLVAHNAKFEMLYELRFSWEAMQAFFKRGGTIWCTQYAEYLLEGQRRDYHMNSLDQLTKKYGGRVKIDAVKELWEAGVQTIDIDQDLLTDYLIGTEEEHRNSGDIGNTEMIYIEQIKAAEEMGMLEAIKVRMGGLIATSYMEFFGLKIDRERAEKDLAEREHELASAMEELNSHLSFIPEEVNFNWGSRTHTSCLIFGGTIKYQKQDTYIDPSTGELARKKATEDWPLFDGVPRDPADCEFRDNLDLWVYFENVPISGDKESADVFFQDKFLSGKKKGAGKFKKVSVPGELKVKYQDFFFKLGGFTEPEPEWKGANTDGVGGPVYSTSSEVIEQIAGRNIPFLKALGERERLTKEIGTYYRRETPKGLSGMLTCVMDDDTVHHKLNHTSTVTSRLSSNDPRMLGS